ncbi:MAG: hypothetical protein ACKVTZ_10070 [Bacteroidia bacterium]
MKQTITLLFLGISLSLFTTSCNESNNDDTSTFEVNQKGSVQIELTTKHIDKEKDVLITARKIWREGVNIKTDTLRDTIPALGETKEWGEDAEGNEKELTVPRDYEFFVTVK